MPPAPSTVHWRFLVLFAGSLALFAAAWWILQLQERRGWRTVEENLRAEAARQLQRWVTIAERPLTEFLADYGGSPALREFLARPHPDWAREHLETALLDRHVQFVWVLRNTGELVYQARRDPEAALPEIPAPDQLLRARPADRQDLGDFVRTSAGELWQLRAVAIRDRNDVVAGWLIAGRAWNEPLLRWLGGLSGATARLLPADAAPAEPSQNELNWRRALTDFEGRTVGMLELAQRFEAAPERLAIGWTRAFFVLFATALIAAFALAVRAWVLRPLDLIGRSLADGAPGAVEPLLVRDDEFARVAQLVRQSSVQRAALENEIAERRRAEEALRSSEDQLRHAIELRSRLARDLHDHVIQSIYAAGLGLESARARSSTDPFGHDTRIRQCMATLNETIHQVRSYINDLEPDAPVRRQRFTDAVRALTATMRELWPVVFELDLDELLSARLTSVAELHALQIVRESLSNAIRHGRASRVDIRFHADGSAAALLEVRDNGSGFDPVQRMGTGRGLVNLTTRAREMGATLRIDSAEGQGATVALHLPLPEGKT